MMLPAALLLIAGIAAAGWARAAARDHSRLLVDRLGDPVVGRARRSELDAVAIRLGPVIGRPPFAGYRQWVMTTWVRAGRRDPSGVAVHLGRVVMCVSAGVVGGAVMALAGAPVAGLLVVASGAVWLDAQLWATAARRRREIDSALPDLLDLLAAVLGAGSTLGSALEQVVPTMVCPLGDELTRVLAETEIGVPFVEGVTELAQRCGSAPLTRFAGAIAQAHRLGTPLAGATIGLADQLRAAAVHSARREAARIAPRISLVLSTVIVPGSLVLLLAAVILGSGLDISSLTGS